MDEKKIIVPDFYVRLRLQPGRELDQFTARLWHVVELRDELSPLHWEQRCTALDNLYQRHGQISSAEHFAQVITTEELATDPSDEGIKLREIGHVSFLEMPKSSKNVALKQVKCEPRYYGYGTDRDVKDWIFWSAHSHIESLFKYALDECRRSGGMRVPEHWTPSTLMVPMQNELWSCVMRDGYMFYKGITAPIFYDLLEFARTLYSKEPKSWLIAGNGPSWNQSHAIEETALYTWDTAMTYYANKRYAEAIDTLRILSNVGCFHPRLERIAREFLKADNLSIRYNIAECLSAHADNTISEPSLSPTLLSDVVECACRETVRAIAEKLVSTIRCQGGKASFDALIEVARNAAIPYTRDAASRALAWVPRYPERLQKLSKLVRSRDDKRISMVAMKALKESKMHGLFSREGEFASIMEHSINDSLRGFFSSDGHDEKAFNELEYAFANKFIRLEIEGVPGNPGCKVTIMTCNEVPLNEESEHTLEFCGLLNRLPSVNIPQAQLSDDELEEERALRITFNSSANRFYGRQRRLFGQALMAVNPSNQKTIAGYIDKFLEMQKQEDTTSDFIFSLDPNQSCEGVVVALLLILEALPDFAKNIRNMLFKGPDTGTESRIKAIRALCPNLQTFWGYVNNFPKDGAEDMKRFIEIKDKPAQFNRQKLQGLSGTEHIVLWNKVDGYQAPKSHS